MGERKMFATRLDQDLLKELKHLAVEQNRRLNDLLEEAMRDLLRKYGKEVEEGQGKG
ncbi:putative transcriptional regulator [Thermosulfuriphilus ammonigenes]|uniref:ribbon-helix-helix domain-containing protein n=1 Tax=Thermosulfuriphilus ammonigenes TaxID=1936021 RepID=UPI001407AEAA|nr:ribbon-helix-helix domain-containing protein [Thermosulfuriphilus ammonigenes]MBA2848682.1 putative transcriptional regulator [Thermosulfuriphilus ammonigenes]